MRLFKQPLPQSHRKMHLKVYSQSHPSAAPVPVRAVLEHRRVLRLRNAEGRLPCVRRDCREGAVGRWEGTPDDKLPLVPGALG